MFADLLSIAVLTVLIMVSPGPDLALVIRNTVQGGKVGGFWTSAGILTGNLVHVSYCIAGIGWLIANNITIFTMLKLAGGTYLIFLGVQSFRATKPETAAWHEDVPAGGKWWVQGFINNLLNPKGALFYLGIFAVYTQPDSAARDLTFIVATMMGISALFWLVFVQVLQANAVRALLSTTGQWVNRILGVALIGLGVRLWFAESSRG